MHQEETNLPVKAAAMRLGVSVSTLYQLVASRRIGHYRIRGKILFTEQDIAAFLSSCRVGVAAAPAAATPVPRLKLKHINLS